MNEGYKTFVNNYTTDYITMKNILEILDPNNSLKLLNNSDFDDFLESFTRREISEK